MIQTAAAALSQWLQAEGRAIAAWLTALRQRVRHALMPVRSPVPYDWFADDEVAGYDATFPDDDPARIDDATWRDLEVKALLRRMAEGASIYARQYLFHRLRRGATFARDARPAWMGRDEDAGPVLARTATARLDLCRQEREATAILFGKQLVSVPSTLRHVRWAKALWMLALASIATPWGSIGALLGVTYLVVYGMVEIRFHGRLALWRSQRSAVLAMLKALVDLGESARIAAHPILQDVASDLEDARRLWRDLDLDLSERKVLSEDYVGLLTLHAFATLPTRIERLADHLPRLRTLYATLAECDGRLCLLAHLRQQPRWCWSHASSARDLELDDMTNPLLDDAQPLSLALAGKGVFLTGQNGVGKSTFLRGVGLNLLVARAFGFCYATQATVPALPVWGSSCSGCDLGRKPPLASMRVCGVVPRCRPHECSLL